VLYLFSGKNLPTLIIFMSKKTGVPRERKLASADLLKAIYKLYSENPGKKFTSGHIIEKLRISNNKDSVKHAHSKLEAEGVLQPFVSAPRNKVGEPNSNTRSATRETRSGEAPPQRGTYEGTVDVTRSGAVFVTTKEFEKDVFVPEKFMNTAQHGDTVMVSVYFSARRNRPDGEIVKVIKRATENFIGTLQLMKNIGVVVPDRLNMPGVVVSVDHLMGANDGDKVTVKVTDFGENNRLKRYKGEITGVLGTPGTSDIEMKSILINHGFNILFPEDVVKESEKIYDDIEAEVKHRRDFRGITTFTIDPFDAKDFDDALSFQVLPNGNIEIGVHIADVTHYIKPNTALDREAYYRSTSVYLVDRVCPMLPERISNELCSLRPFEDKLTFSAVFEFDEAHNVVNKWFGKTIIHSTRRFSYEEAQKVLETAEGDLVHELLTMNKIAYALRKKRFKNGAINFETEEVKFRLDENGVPVEVFVKERKDSNMLIEDYMLLANKEVAYFMSHKEKGVEVPYIYRIHDEPDINKIADFALFARTMGVKMNIDTPKHIAESLNNLAKLAETDDKVKMLTPLAIRCMAKAAYSTDNIGHYGLAFEYYSHFTSPIRRYSDVLAHRILFENLKGTVRVNKEKLEEECKHISAQERKAAECERESVKYKQVEYIQQHIGGTFDGIINGMNDRGFFIELTAYFAEGMAIFARCPENFDVEPSRLRAKGARTGKTVTMGQSVKVQIVDAVLQTRQIDMKLLEY